jgi:spermidine/putrescine transport system substrate-binding protein
MRSSRRPSAPGAAAILSRRNLLCGALTGAAVVASGGALAACGTKPAKQSGAKACTATDVSATEKKLTWSNWPLYIDVDAADQSKRPSIDGFTAKTGIAVTYQEDVNDNNDFFGKIRNQLQACRSIDRDVIVMTDWMASRLVGLGWLQRFDPARTQNFTRNVLPNLKNRPWDKDMVYAAPWQSGLTGIAYNAKVAKEVRSIDELLTRSDLKGRIAVLTEMRDTMGLMLLSNGKDPLNFTAADFDAALEKLKKANDSGQIRKFTGNDYKEDLAKGDLAACVAWSGDVIQLAAADDQIRFVPPEEGLMLWSDNILIPSTATHKANAEQLVDYYYDPQVAARVAATVNYICPVNGAREAMGDIDKSLADNPLIFPDSATLAKAKGFKALTEAEEKDYSAKFEQVAGS